ncbi:sigma-54-dependent Fis family transcriptional regulator [Candidatus Saganbacteria bacterium]|uniref:Sigma-54-dependent Fis family transcriptional regulator n=1 Tax=Candidatus Saganbacteria bacterium TaxID=2575572 RepID=A0A9D6UMJ9_UNCSA|nr:sigma-54-dependent Fis family transcriptional regulator [Candidatus Saganbacteria bacterium]
MNKILVVDDEFSIRESFSLILEGKCKVVTAASGEGALKAVTDHKIDLVFLDIRMPGLDGLETLTRIKEIDPGLEVIMVTAVNDMRKAGEAIKLGAFDYLVKPFNVDSVLRMTEQILQRKELMAKGKLLRKEAYKKSTGLIGQSEKIIEITKTIEKTASKSSRVLLLGEAGVEKEAVAALIHESGSRADRPFGLLNLLASMSVPEIKNRLFGSGKGSTTADLEKITGLFEEVGNGTLFLNHIEYFTPEILASQPGGACLIGGSEIMDLADKAKEIFDLFSETLITIPPLRKRISDIPLLLNHWLEEYSDKYGKETLSVSPEVEEIFSVYPWPGNTDELKSLLERLVITTASNQITPADLPLDFLIRYPEASGGDYFSAFEKKYIRRIFEEVGQNKEKLAAALKVNPILLEGRI